MDRIIELVRRYQNSEDEAEREAAADEVLSEIYASLTIFIRVHAAKGCDEDVLQETLRDLFEGLWAFDGETSESFWSWAYRITRRRCADSFRGRKVTQGTVADPKLLEAVLADLRDENRLTQAEWTDLKAGIALLKVTDYPCLGWLWDRYYVGLSFVELGEQEGVTEEAAQKRVRRCLELAARLMNP